MKVGDLVEWAPDGDVGIIVQRHLQIKAPQHAQIQGHWSNGELEWMWEKQDGLKNSL